MRRSLQCHLPRPRRQSVIDSLHRGVAQGEYNAGLLSNLCFAPIIREVESKYPTSRPLPTTTTFYILWPAADAFEAAKLYAQLLKDHLNLIIQPTESFVYCPSPSPADAALIASHCASTGVVSLPPADGIVVALVGTEAFERSFKAKHFSSIMAKFNFLPNVASLIADGKVGNLTKQLFMLCRLCIASKATFILRCVPPSRTYDTCRKFDLDFFQQLQLSFPELKGGAAFEQRNCSSDRTMLPLRLGGVGVPCASDAVHAAYLGSLFLAGHRVASLHVVADADAFDALLPDVVELDATVAFFTALSALNDQKPIWHTFSQPYASANGPDGDEHSPDKAKDYEGPPATAFENPVPELHQSVLVHAHDRQAHVRVRPPHGLRRPYLAWDSCRPAAGRRAWPSSAPQQATCHNRHLPRALDGALRLGRSTPPLAPPLRHPRHHH